MLIWIEDVHQDNTHPLLTRHEKSRFLPHNFYVWMKNLEVMPWIWLITQLKGWKGLVFFWED